MLILNPLHPRLPRLVILIQLTCNRFDAVFVRKQWEKVRALWSIHLLNVVGPLIGHASDGDARRRKLMLEDFGATDGIRFTIPWDGWLFSAKVLGNSNALCTMGRSL